MFCKNFVKRPFFPLICLGILTIIAIGDYIISGFARRTIVFYQYGEAEARPVIEERFLKRTWDAEEDLRLYIEEVLLGPESFDSARLVAGGTVLESFSYKDGDVLIALSADAAVPDGTVFLGNGGLTGNLRSVAADIRRNFRGIKEIRFFAGGHEALKSVPQ